MNDENRTIPPADDTAVSRRGFTALTVAAGVTAAAGVSPALAAQAQVVETNVEVKTPDGTCDAAFVHPATGTYPGVLLWSDALGLRPAVRDMAKRLAAEGYAVLAPNPFYRSAKAPVFGPNFSFQNQADMARLNEVRGPMTPEAINRDAVAFIAFLDSQASVNKAAKIGTQGYCMGGPLIMRTAAAVPDRVGAAASFHGGGLATDMPDSPHLLIPKMKAKLYYGVAANDDMRDPEAKNKLKAAHDAAGNPAEIEVYPAQHGWCMKDMPSSPQGPIYNEAQAERAWTKLLALYKGALV